MVRLCLAALLLASGAAHADPTLSKLSLHLLGSYTEGATHVVRMRPRVLKVLDASPEMLRALREYKEARPDGLTILRVYTPPFALGDDPDGGARLFMDRVLAPALEDLTEDDRRLIDFVEGPNECEHFAAWETVESAAWYGRFWAALARLIADAGFRPCVGSIPVGNPPGPPDEIAAKFAAFVPALQAAKEANGAWSYHSYSLAYTTDPAEEAWTSLRYRMLHAVLEEGFADLVGLPLILTEAGIDKGGDRENDGWQARGDAGRFRAWLEWYDRELAKDPYVLGATLFQSGDPVGWPSFEVEPVLGWLCYHMLSSTF